MEPYQTSQTNGALNGLILARNWLSRDQQTTLPYSQSTDALDGVRRSPVSLAVDQWQVNGVCSFLRSTPQTQPTPTKLSHPGALPHGDMHF